MKKFINALNTYIDLQVKLEELKTGKDPETHPTTMDYFWEFTDSLLVDKPCQYVLDTAFKMPSENNLAKLDEKFRNCIINASHEILADNYEAKRNEFGELEYDEDDENKAWEEALEDIIEHIPHSIKVAIREDLR